jgi:hypothetical protein
MSTFGNPDARPDNFDIVVPNTVAELIPNAEQSQFDRLNLQFNELWGLAVQATPDEQAPADDLARKGVLINGVMTYAGVEEDGAPYATFTRLNYNGATKDVYTLIRNQEEGVAIVVHETLTPVSGTPEVLFEHNATTLTSDMTSVYQSVQGESTQRGVLMHKHNHVDKVMPPLMRDSAEALFGELQILQATIDAAPRKNRIFSWLGKIGRRGTQT